MAKAVNDTAQVVKTLEESKSLVYDKPLAIVSAFGGDQQARQAIKKAIMPYRIPLFEKVVDKVCGISPASAEVASGGESQAVESDDADDDDDSLDLKFQDGVLVRSKNNSKKTFDASKDANGLDGHSGGSDSNDPNDENNNDRKKHFDSLDEKELKKAAKSHEKLIEDHQRKISEYSKNPDIYDNKKFLENAPAELRNSIIKKRLQSLKNQIFRQSGDLKYISNLIKIRHG